ncbi:MAG: cytochrome c oxidase subunit II [Bacteroidales bacterium]|jgi:cytochrome c oxidase subunit 2|nr:cytochrome c oxidase subunit II [Bacteroidales bacterium]
MFSQASNFVEGVDKAFLIISGISLVFLIGITFAMILFVVKFNKKRNPVAKNVKESRSLEIVWTVIPTLLVLVMFYYGWAGYAPMRDFPDDAIQVKATGRMWSWSFEYENGKISPTLIVPIDKAVTLNLYSPDVLHSLYIPAFRIKEDLVPGINNKMWFEAGILGEYDILCAEYCGERHSYMLSKVEVLTQEEYDAWYYKVDDNTNAAEAGLKILQVNGCVACHSLDGTRLVGPSFKGLWYSTKTVTTGVVSRQVTADEEYIKESIYNPSKDMVDTYPKVMISYKESINEEQLKQINAYLKSIEK